MKIRALSTVTGTPSEFNHQLVCRANTIETLLNLNVHFLYVTLYVHVALCYYHDWAHPNVMSKSLFLRSRLVHQRLWSKPSMFSKHNQIHETLWSTVQFIIATVGYVGAIWSTVAIHNTTNHENIYSLYLTTTDQTG